MTQWLFDLCSRPPFARARLAQRVRARIVRAWNPDVRDRLEGRELVVPLSHDLAWNRLHFPAYGDNLRRVAGFLRARDGRLRYVDVGANVGDTYLLTRPAPGDTALLVEGSKRYFELLRRNVGSDPGVTCVHALLSDVASEASGAMTLTGGNARVEAGASGAGAGFETLDGVLAKHPAVGVPDLLKTDVEGWDGRVLRGARGLLANAAPVVIFEHHPRLVALAGDDDSRVFADLAALGYGSMILYDNFGALLGTLDPRDAGAVRARVAEALKRQDYYYDIIAFPGRRAADRDAFLALEHGAAGVPATR